MADPVSWVIGAVTLVGAGVNSYSSYESSRAQQKNQQYQAEYQARQARRNIEIAQINAANAQAEGKEAKQTGEENAARQRQEVSKLIGRQRAAAGASGVTVDSGAFLDVYMDTAERGEIDALALAEEGRRVDYNKRVEAWNYQQQAAGNAEQANMYAQQNTNHINPWLQAGGTLLSGLSSAGSNFYRMSKGMGTPSNSNSTISSATAHFTLK